MSKFPPSRGLHLQNAFGVIIPKNLDGIGIEREKNELIHSVIHR